MTNEAEIEKMIVDRGHSAPRLTPQHIDAQIVAEYTRRASDMMSPDVPVPDAARRALSCMTVAFVVLRNGFVLTGESACASPENYDAEIGAKIALDNARKKIWALEGYALRTKLAEAA